MKISICCSDIMKEKLNRKASKSDLEIDEHANILLVEYGFDLDKNKINIVFNPIYFDEVLDLILGNRTITEALTGFSNNRYEILTPRDILYLEARSANIYAVTSKCEYLMKKKLYEYEQDLMRHDFFRINKSQLVNLMAVKEIIPWFNGRFVLNMGEKKELEVSKSYARNFKDKLGI